MPGIGFLLHLIVAKYKWFFHRCQYLFRYFVLYWIKTCDGWEKVTEDVRYLHKIAAPLLLWYDQKARSLPWRENPTPYRVWISEIMLQQTRVEAVRAYFDRFIAALPDAAALAQVKDDTLLKLWEGLGYYSRARNLKKAAETVMTVHNGEFPRERDQLLALPGIGPYTAGAIASIAYGEAVPAVDGNVLRVVSRYLGRREDIAKEKTKKDMAKALAAVIPSARAGDFNQALMELGALLCLPKKARCENCPLHALCRAYREGVVAEIPVKTAKKPRRREEHTVFLFFHQGRIAMKNRSKSGLLAGMWELPNLMGHLDRVEVFSAFPDLTFTDLLPLPEAKHVFTHLEWQMIGYAVWLEEPQPDWIWVTEEEMDGGYPLPTAFKFYRRLIPSLLGNTGK